MTIFLYDGSFEGLMCAIACAYRHPEPVSIKKTDAPAPLLLGTVIEVQTEKGQARRVIDAILKKLGMDTFKSVSYAFFSESPEIETALLFFLKYAFNTGPKAVENLSHPCVRPIFEASRKVSREVHLLIGLIRFSQTSYGIYYSRYEPTYDITALLAPHFAERLGDQIWVLHDVSRQIAAFYDQKDWWLSELEPGLQTYSASEYFYQDLWQRYFKHISIESRVSDSRQRQHMPKKYWKYLVEIKR